MLAITFVLALLTGLQGIPVLADQSGVITGVLKDASGKPAPGVRVGAIAVPDSAADIADASAMVSLAATDEAGRYRLENIPPGKYYVSAGRVDFPTYYPGTQALARGTIIAISPKAVVDGIDFSMQDSSARVAGPQIPNATGLTFSLPL
jgi:5-hydroxyisourate hydrolase-like protein (transthyretin family)